MRDDMSRKAEIPKNLTNQYLRSANMHGANKKIVIIITYPLLRHFQDVRSARPSTCAVIERDRFCGQIRSVPGVPDHTS